MLELILKEHFFYPDEYHKNVYMIRYELLFEKGIRALLVDLDNTLIPYDETHPNDDIRALFNRLEKIGFEVVIISNNKQKRVETFAKELDVRFICSAKKPLRGGFLRALALAGDFSPNQVCVIGDQFMTDLFGGKRMNYYVIIVDAIKRNVEKWFTKLNRRLEKRMLKLIHKHHPDIYNSLRLYEKR